jgi:hypothetical protein
LCAWNMRGPNVPNIEEFKRRERERDQFD